VVYCLFSISALTVWGVPVAESKEIVIQSAVLSVVVQFSPPHFCLASHCIALDPSLRIFPSWCVVVPAQFWYSLSMLYVVVPLLLLWYTSRALISVACGCMVSLESDHLSLLSLPLCLPARFLRSQCVYVSILFRCVYSFTSSSILWTISLMIVCPDCLVDDQSLPWQLDCLCI
jgi:hypothetical protein